MNKKIYPLFLIFLWTTHFVIQSKKSIILPDTKTSNMILDKISGDIYLLNGNNITDLEVGQRTIYRIKQDFSSNITATDLSAGSEEKNNRITTLALGRRASGSVYLATGYSFGLLTVKDLQSNTNCFTAGHSNSPRFTIIIKTVATNVMKKNGDNTNYNFIISAISAADNIFTSVSSGVESSLALSQLTEPAILTNITQLPFTRSSVWVRGNGGDIQPEDANNKKNSCCLTWSNELQRLFVGIGGKSHQHDGNQHSLITLSCFKLNDTFTGLENVQINSILDGYDTGSTAASSSIIGMKNNNQNKFRLREIAIMHTSTDKYYTIICGGSYANSTDQPKLFALPLVGPEGDHPGALAAIFNTNIPTIDFNTRATGYTQLFHETDSAALVGTYHLTGIPSTSNIINIEAIGDTVYYSFFDGLNNGGGIFYSQALFNSSGAICGWTDWARATPTHLSGISNANARCDDFTIDIARGKLWTSANGTVNSTEWKYQTDITTFGGQINTKLQGPSYSHLVLDQYTENFGNQVIGRYALFGGKGKVVAIKTATTYQPAINDQKNNAAYDKDAQTSNLTWNNPTNAAVDFSRGLPAESEILTLGYSQIAESNTLRNFFFAGTNNGLYVYCNSNGSGFRINPLGILGETTLRDGKLVDTINDPLSVFNAGEWIKYPSKNPLWKNEDPITHIVTKEPGVMSCLAKGKNGDYIVELSITGLNVTNITEKICFNETDGLDAYGIYSINAMLPVNKNGVRTVLSGTNNGILGSTSGLSILNKTIAQHLSAPQRTRNNSMFWIVEDIQDITTGNIIPKSCIYQATMDTINDVSITNKSHTFSLTPTHPINTNFHSITLSDIQDADRHKNFKLLDKITTPFYSNGSLRFFGMRSYDENGEEYTKLVTLPYRVDRAETNITDFIDIPDEDLKKVRSIYWINNVGAGYMMIGTDIGVLSLE